MVLSLELLKPYILMVIIVGIFPLVAGYMVLMERKLMADMQVRLGPMRVGPQGLLQPIADAVKLLIKEDIMPAMGDKLVFWLAPVVSCCTALLAFSVIPFSSSVYVADLNIGILFILAVSSVGVLGIILGGWASNSHYPLLGSLRSTAQMVSYEVVMGFSIVAVLLMSGTLSMTEIVKQQAANGAWFVFGNSPWTLPFALVACFMYLVAGMAETNRAPFDLPEAESELVAGFMTEYSGFRWALYFLAEYANMFIVSSIAVTLFFGGWLRPFASVKWLGWLDYAAPVLALLSVAGVCSFIMVRRSRKMSDKLILAAVAAGLVLIAALYAWPAFNVLAIGLFWFLAKVFGVIYLFMWARFTFPRYRYDQLMSVGWRLLIPVGIANVIAIATVIALRG